MRSTVLRRLAAGAAALVVLGAVGACGDEGSGGGADAAPSSDASAEPSAEPSSSGGSGLPDDYPYDLAEVGDDLLGDTTWSRVLEGGQLEASWKFPASYDNNLAEDATLSEGGTTYRVLVGGRPDVDRRAGVQEIADNSDDPGDEAATYEVAVNDRDFSVATVYDESAGTSLRGFLITPEDAAYTYAVLFYADEPLDETPDERLDEFHEMVASLEFGPPDDNPGSS